jgi:integrase/recombinase XerD
MGFPWQGAHALVPPLRTCLARQGAECIPPAWALCWATPPRHVQPAAWARRLRVGRGFAPYHRAVAPRTAMPPPALLPSRSPRRAPSLSSEAALTRVLQAARQLPSPTGLRAHT